jgi:O-antigen ligase
LDSTQLLLIKEKVYFGHGLDTWMNLSDPFLKQFPDAHNMILEVLLSTGVLGLDGSFYGYCLVFYLKYTRVKIISYLQLLLIF